MIVIIVFLHAPSGQWQASPGMAGQPAPDNLPLYPMNPNYIFMGQRLSGSVNAYSWDFV
jgi:hypothetical protein